MSDIEFLAIKEFEGKLRKSTSSRTTAGDGALLTANAGKDMYIAHASATITHSNVAAGNVTLVVNGVVVGEAFVSGQISGGSGDATENFYFPFGFKVLAGQTIKLNVVAAGVRVTTNLVCFEEDTGDSPRII